MFWYVLDERKFGYYGNSNECNLSSSVKTNEFNLIYSKLLHEEN